MLLWVIFVSPEMLRDKGWKEAMLHVALYLQVARKIASCNINLDLLTLDILEIII